MSTFASDWNVSTAMQMASLVLVLLTTAGSMLASAAAVIRKIGQRDQALIDLTASVERHAEGAIRISTAITHLEITLRHLERSQDDHETRLRRIEADAAGANT